MKSISRLLLFFTFIFFFYVSNSIPDYDLAYQVVLFFPCLWLLSIDSRKTNLSYTKFFFLVFYSLGYPIYLAVMYLTLDQYTIGGWMGIGNFDFRAQQLQKLSVTSASLMLGIIFGIELCSKMLRPKKPKYSTLMQYCDTSLLNAYVQYWFLSSMMLIGFMAVLGLGRTGLQDAVTLPFGIKGILLYCRYILIPLIGMYLLGKSIEVNKTKIRNNILLYLIIISISVALAALSRSDLVFILAPAVLFIATHEQAMVAKFGRSLTLKIVLVIIIATQAVQIYRDMAYTAEGAAGLGIGQIVAVLDAVELEVIFNNLLTLVTVRQGGSRDMAVVLNSSYQSPIYIWDFFWQIGEENFMIDVWEFDLEAFDQDGKSYGTGFNGFGWYAFGGNIPLVFMLSIVTGYFAQSFESLFNRHGFKSVQIFVALYMTLSLWNSFVWGRFWRVIPIMLIGLYIIKRLNRNLCSNKHKINEVLNEKVVA